MSVLLDPELLAYDLAIRGLSAFNGAKKAGISPATMSHGLNGILIAPDSARFISQMLDETPIFESLVRLIVPPKRIGVADPRPESEVGRH